MEFDIVVRRAASPPDDDEDPEREMTVADYVRAGESCVVCASVLTCPRPDLPPS